MKKKKRGQTDVTENHKMIDGRLLQTNKKYSQLKMKQKEKIAEWMFQATRDYYMKNVLFRVTNIWKKWWILFMKN